MSNVNDASVSRTPAPDAPEAADTAPLDPIEHIELGLPVSDAVRAALKDRGYSSAGEWCEAYDIPRTSTAEALGGTRTATEKQLSALVATFGGTVDQWAGYLARERERVASRATAGARRRAVAG